jgi:hypothetical protein
MPAQVAIPDAEQAAYSVLVGDPALANVEAIPSNINQELSDPRGRFITAALDEAPAFLGRKMPDGYAYFKRLDGKIRLGDEDVSVYRRIDDGRDPDVHAQVSMVSDDYFTIAGVEWRIGPFVKAPVFFNGRISLPMLASKYADSKIMTIPDVLRKSFEVAEAELNGSRASVRPPTLSVTSDRRPIVIGGPNQAIRSLTHLRSEASKETDQLLSLAAEAEIAAFVERVLSQRDIDRAPTDHRLHHVLTEIDERYAEFNRRVVERSGGTREGIEFGNIPTRASYANVLARLFEISKPISEKTILEVGSGVGGLQIYFRELGKPIEGLERNPDAAAMARELGHAVWDGDLFDPPQALVRQPRYITLAFHVFQWLHEGDHKQSHSRRVAGLHAIARLTASGGLTVLYDGLPFDFSPDEVRDAGYEIIPAFDDQRVLFLRRLSPAAPSGEAPQNQSLLSAA